MQVMQGQVLCLVRIGPIRPVQGSAVEPDLRRRGPQSQDGHVSERILVDKITLRSGDDRGARGGELSKIS